MSNMMPTWWKWGDPEKSFHLNDFPELKQFLEEKWKKKLADDFKIPDRLSSLTVSSFTLEDFKSIFPELNPSQFSIDNEERLRYAFGKSYHDAIRIFTDDQVIAPDFVLFPESVDDVVHILKQAEKNQITVITFSGGSNVTGAVGIEAPPRPSPKGGSTSALELPPPLSREQMGRVEDNWTCSLNMKRMDRLIDIDPVSLTATFEAGIYGPELERILYEQGFTLGHFPQSFEFSTLGGWLATRSAGQESGLYGKIEDMVLGLKVVTPRYTIEQTDFPKHASGIDVHPLFIGSEGTLGVIVHAKMRIHRKPGKYKWVVALFKDLESGVSALQKIVQSGIHPAISRLSDTDETKMLSLFSQTKKKGFQKLARDWMKSYLAAKGYQNPSILMMRFAINNLSDITASKVASKIARAHKAKLLPASVSDNWEKNRFALPYLRDTLIEHRIVIDTFETVTYWKDLLPLYHHIRDSLKKESDYFEKGGLLFCHLSHIYQTGASLYFTLMAQQEKDNELNQWLKIKEIVSKAIIDHGGAISHHHGIGKDHRKWYLQKLTAGERKILQTIKQHFDPNSILNPGKLFDENTGMR
ncbi:MAG: FAD-binding oxidoreductase [Bacteroidota bacterium]